MPEDSKTLRIFISSPGDVQTERQRVEKAIERLGKQAHITPHFRLNPLLWEDVPPEGGSPPQTTIDRYLGEAGEADIYICILWHRMGTPTQNAKGESFRSGTECEFFSAYRANATNNGTPHLLFYHCQRPQSPEIDPEQSKLVKEFLARFKGANPELKGLFHHYTEIDEFEHRIATDLNTIIVKHFLAPRQTQTQRRDFYQHIDLPPNYIPREELLAELRTALLSNTNAVAITSVKAKPTALHGMGGIGKSVMARALCDDPQVREAYPDGILWTTLGQEPNLKEKLSEWIHALGGVILENAPTLDQLKNNLNKLLDGRQCLLVVDDVWRKVHAEVFRAGNRCRILLTTRDAAIAKEVGAIVQPVPLMPRDEAVRLLEECAEGNLQTVEGSLKERIVERLGRLPLALQLAGPQLSKRDPETWLASFDVHQLKARRIEGMHDSLAKTFELSLETLGDARPLYTALAIFKEDEAIPEPALHRLWSGLANFEATRTAELLEDLASRALLTLDSKATPRRASLHDLLRDLLASELNDESRRQVHARLLQTYRATCSGAGWHTAPDDGYLYDHLVYHLESVQQREEVQALFKDQNWMQVRVPQRDYAYDGYLNDLMAVWQEAHKCAQAQIAAHEIPAALADCVRCALIRTSVNSLAANYEPALVARAVEIGLWSAQRALSLAAKVPAPEQRATFYIALLATARLEGEARVLAQQQGLAAARAIEDEEERAHVLVALAPQLTGENLREGLAAAREIEDEEERAPVLVALAPQFTGENLREGLAAAREIEDEWYRAQVLVALAPQLTGEEREQVLREGLAAARAIEDEEERAQVLVVLAPQLTGENLREGLATARAIEDQGTRAHLLVALAPLLTGEKREQVLREGLAAAREIEDKKERAGVLVALAPLLQHEQVRATLLEFIERLQNEERSKVLALFTHEKLFAPPILSPEILAAIAQHTIEICQKWQWL